MVDKTIDAYISNVTTLNMPGNETHGDLPSLRLNLIHKPDY